MVPAKPVGRCRRAGGHPLNEQFTGAQIEAKAARAVHGTVCHHCFPDPGPSAKEWDGRWFIQWPQLICPFSCRTCGRTSQARVPLIGRAPSQWHHRKKHN